MGIKIIEALTEPQILIIDEEANRLVGFTRILNDYIYRATIFDV